MRKSPRGNAVIFENIHKFFKGFLVRERLTLKVKAQAQSWGMELSGKKPSFTDSTPVNLSCHT